MAAADPRNTKKRVYVHPSMFNFQSHVVDNAPARKLMSFAHSTDSVMPMALDSGSQKTENPYAIPIHRWMASAAGGTSQRLNPGLAMVRSRARKPGVAGEGKTSVVDIMTGALRGVVCRAAAKCHSLAKPNLERTPIKVANVPWTSRCISRFVE
jgi:hypothetical protein